MTTRELLRRAKAAKGAMALADTGTKNRALLAMADALIDHTQPILTANGLDLIEAKGTVSNVMLDRLALSEERIFGMAQGMREVTALPEGRSGPTALSSKRPPSPWGWWPSSRRAALTSPPMRRR